MHMCTKRDRVHGGVGPRHYPCSPGEGEAGQGQSLGSVPRWVVTSPSSTLNPGTLKWDGSTWVGSK